MDWETVKLPVNVSAEDVDRLMTDRKKIRLRNASTKNCCGGK
jgi:hypothetical protein